MSPKLVGDDASAARPVKQIVVILFIGLVTYYVVPRKQSFTVFASTEYLSVRTVSAQSPDWEMAEIQACVRRENEVSKSAGLDWCDPDFYDQYRLSDAVLRWTDGYTLVLQGIETSALLVSVSKADKAAQVILDGFNAARETDENEPATKAGQSDAAQQQTDEIGEPNSVVIGNGTLLRIPFDARTRPVLPMRGRVTIGDVPIGRHNTLLREGRYEIRQHLALNRRPPVVAAGQLFPGDRIGFAKSDGNPWSREAEMNVDRDVIATLFVTDISRLSPAFDLVATTPPEFSALRQTRVGGKPTLIPVTWSERLAADPLPVAVATLLGLLATCISLVNAYFAKSTAKPRNRDKTGSG